MTEGPDDIRISAIICTYNGERRIEAALESLFQQAYACSRFEILVVDNGSTDATSEVCRDVMARHPEIATRYVREPRGGLSNARNRGIAEARGDIVAFLDDDAAAETAWLTNVDTMFVDHDVDAVGGKVLPVFEESRPSWLHPGLDFLVTSLDLGDEVVEFNYPRNGPCGTNMAFKRSVFDEIGHFDTALGRNQGSLIGAEETGIFIRMRQKGMRFVYASQCVVQHHVPKGRATKRYIRRRSYYQGISAARLSLAYSTFTNSVLHGIRTFLSGVKEGDRRCASARRHGKRGKAFYYQTKAILYTSYLLFLVIGALRSKTSIGQHA